MFRKINVWRIVSTALGVLLVLSVGLNLSGGYQVPQQATLFMFGALAAIGVGYSVVNPGASLTLPGPLEENGFAPGKSWWVLA